MVIVVRRTALVVLAGFALAASTVRAASADVAEGWSKSPTVSGLDMLWIFVGAPILLYLVVAVLAYLPGLVKGERTPSKELEREDTWFRDPRL